MVKEINIGDAITSPEDAEYTFSISFKPEEVLSCWEEAGRIADTIAEYYRETLGREMDYASLTMVINELIENATKFSKNGNSIINVCTSKNRNHFHITITNEVNKMRWELFQKVSSELFSSDLNNLFKNRLLGLREKRPSSSGLGLILLKKDFKANLMISFREYNSERLGVVVRAAIPL